METSEKKKSRKYTDEFKAQALQLAEDLAEVHALAAGIPVHAVSAKSGHGIDIVHQYLGAGKTGALLGSSGGKGRAQNAGRLSRRNVAHRTDERFGGATRLAIFSLD